jgi:hypothetical protein
VTIELSDDGALVIFDLLADHNAPVEGREILIRSATERNALWALEGALERVLVAPLAPDYAEQLDAARARVEERGGSW